MRKCKITVYDYHDATHGASAWHYDKDNPPNVIEYEVEAWCVGGDEGVRAYFVLDKRLYEAKGDDGHWWLASVCSVHWLPEIAEALLAVGGDQNE